MSTVHTVFGLAYPTWGDILVALSLIGGVSTWTLNQIKDRKLRKEEICWRRTEFLFEQAALFDTNEGISSAVKVITGNSVSVSVDDLLDLSSKMSSSDRGEGRHSLDKLLNLMERLATAFEQSIITELELSHFGWYFARVMEVDSLREYCETYYPAILKAAAALDCDAA